MLLTSYNTYLIEIGTPSVYVCECACVCVEGGVVKKGCKSLTTFSTLTVTFFCLSLVVLQWWR